MNQEQWKEIVGHSNYLVSSLGNVKHKKRVNCLKPKDCHGYDIVSFDKKHYRIHRLVASAFIPNPDNKTDVDHINRNEKRNNAVSNLRWVTKSENMTAYYATGGTIQVQPLKFESSIEIIYFFSGSEACKYFNKAKGTIFGAIKTAECKPSYRWNGYTITKISLEEYTKHAKDSCSDSCPHDSNFLTKVLVPVDATKTSQD